MAISLAELNALTASGASRGLAAPRPKDEEDESQRGFFRSAIDIINRPYSTVMGGVTGALDGDLGILEGAAQGLTGKRDFSALDAAEQMGFDPNSTTVQRMSIAADVLNPLDPLNYVGVGFVNKGAKAERAIAKITKGAQHADMLSRVNAAEKGLWSPLTIAGQSVVPAKLSAMIARPVDVAAEKGERFLKYNRIAKAFGGVSKFEGDYPDLVKVIKDGQFENMQQMDDFVQTLTGMHKSLIDQGRDAGEIQLIMREAADMLESPKTKLLELEAEKAAIDSGMDVWKQPRDPLKTQAERVEEEAYNMFSTKANQQRKVELAKEVEALSELEKMAPKQSSTPVYYHASPVEDIKDFNTIGSGSTYGGEVGTHFGTLGQAQKVLDRRGGKGRIYEVSVAISNPLRLTDEGHFSQSEILRQLKKNGIISSDEWESYALRNKPYDVRDIIQSKGYDGIIYANRGEGVGGDSVIAFRPEQITINSPSAKSESSVNTIEAIKAKKLDDLHVMKSVAPDPDDMPPPELMLRRREEIDQQIDRISKLHANAVPDSVNVAETLAPYLSEIKDEYVKRLSQYDPKFRFPIENYLKHMFPAHSAKLSKKGQAKAAEAAESLRLREQQLRVEYAKKGYNDQAIEEAVARDLKKERAVSVGRPFMDEQAFRGNLDAFKRRKNDFTLQEMRQARDEGFDWPPQFEDNAIVIADAMNRDAKRFGFAHDIHKFIVDKGYAVDGDTYRTMDKAAQKQYTALDFHLPFISADKNPFKDKFVKREVYELMQKQVGTMQAFTNRGEWSGVIETLHNFRRWWSAWTLAPFPSFHTRNFVSDVVLARLGGLSPAEDWLKAPKGESAYMTGLAIATRNTKLPNADKRLQAAQTNLDNLLGTINAKFPDAQMDADKLMKYMRKEKIINHGTLRDDLDLLVQQDNALVAEARKTRSKLAKLGDFMPLKADINNSFWVQKGFKVGGHMQDVTRSAMFTHALREGLDAAGDVDTAMEYATYMVRKHHFDYSDLTGFERDVMRLVAPFYTFTSKNIPLQIEKTITEPSRQAWINRFFQGAWAGTDEDEMQYEDLPKWMQDSVGVPMRKTKDAMGNETYSVFTLKGWLPQTELNEVADSLRSDGMLSFLATRINPVFKEFFEQAMNFDSFTGRAIDQGQMVELMGVNVPPRALHLIRNVRLVGEIDKLNPGDWWTKLWEGRGMATEGSGRPHRREAPEMERYARFMTGLNFYNVKPADEQKRIILDANKEANKLKGAARVAHKFGQTAERDQLMQNSKEEMDRARIAAKRLNELRRDKAMQVQEKYQGGRP